MRRTIDEVIALYELEPVTRGDIYLEGETDRELITWCLELSSQRYRSSYSILMIDVSPAIVAKHGLNIGSNRSRVIAMALEVWEELGKDTCKLSFIVDRDLSFFIPGQIPPPGILTTDYAAMDAYLLQSEALNKYARFVCRLQPQNIDEFIDSLYEVVQILFVLRVALDSFGIGVRPAIIQSLLSFDGHRISIDKDDLLQRTLSAGNALARLEELRVSIDSASDQVANADMDRRYFANGHDLLQVLGEAAFKIGQDNAYRKEMHVRKSLLMALSHDELILEPLFRQILN